jgi:hypothetical protein
MVASLPFMGAALIERMSDALKRGDDHTNCRESVMHQEAIAIDEEGAANIVDIVEVGLDREYAPEFLAYPILQVLKNQFPLPFVP